jgi:hypothetical protein
MKLSYWYAPMLEDSNCYSIRTRTKKEAVQAKADHWDPKAYGPVRKVTIEYVDGFDLMEECSVEGRHWWEHTSEA